MATFYARLEKALAHARKDMADLRGHLKISTQAAGQLKHGRSKSLSAENAARAARYLGVSTYWLCTGDGPMIEPTAIRPRRELPFRRVRHEDLLALQDAGKLAEAESFILGLLSGVEPTGTKSRAS